MEDAREEELFVLGRVPSEPKGVRDEPASCLPTRPLAKTLTQNFCQFISEPLLKAPNSELRAYKEVVQSMFKASPTITPLINKGKENKRVSKLKRDLFSRQILFQPEMKQVEEVIT